MLHLARAIVQRCAVGIAGLNIGSIRGICWVEAGKLVEEDGELGSAVEEDDEHGGGKADCEGQLVLVHGSWCEPIKDSLTCQAKNSMLKNTTSMMAKRQVARIAQCQATIADK